MRSRLSPREREVLRHVLTANSTSRLPATSGSDLHTIKVHRGRMMVKLGLQAVADLVRIAKKLNDRNHAAQPREGDIAYAPDPARE